MLVPQKEWARHGAALRWTCFTYLQNRLLAVVLEKAASDEKRVASADDLARSEVYLHAGKGMVQALDALDATEWRRKVGAKVQTVRNAMGKVQGSFRFAVLASVVLAAESVTMGLERDTSNESRNAGVVSF